MFTRTNVVLYVCFATLLLLIVLTIGYDVVRISDVTLKVHGNQHFIEVGKTTKGQFKRLNSGGSFDERDHKDSVDDTYDTQIRSRMLGARKCKLLGF